MFFNGHTVILTRGEKWIEIKPKVWAEIPNFFGKFRMETLRPDVSVFGSQI